MKVFFKWAKLYVSVLAGVSVILLLLMHDAVDWQSGGIISGVLISVGILISLLYTYIERSIPKRRKKIIEKLQPEFKLTGDYLEGSMDGFMIRLEIQQLLKASFSKSTSAYVELLIISFALPAEVSQSAKSKLKFHYKHYEENGITYLKEDFRIYFSVGKVKSFIKEHTARIKSMM